MYRYIHKLRKSHGLNYRQCDQTRPSCRNCTKRKLECSFPLIDPSGRFAGPVPQTLQHSGLAQVLVLPKSRPEPNASGMLSSLPPPGFLDTLLQNGLLQNIPENQHHRLKDVMPHFFTATSASLAVTSSGRATWSNGIPRLANRYPFVVDGVFGVASLHLSYIKQNEAEKVFYSNIAIDQLNKGLAQYRQELSNVTESNAEALFSFSTIMSSWVVATVGEECAATIQTLKTSGQSMAERDAATTDLAFSTARIFRYLRGVLFILTPYWTHISKGVFGPITQKDWSSHPVPASPSAVEADRKLHALERMWMRPGRKYEYYFDTLASTLKSLRESFALISQLSVPLQDNSDSEQYLGYQESDLTDWTAVMPWVIHARIEFAVLLEQRVLEAWVILAHYAILPARARGVWWLEKLPENIVSGAAVVVGEENWGLIEWPARCVGVDLGQFRQSDRPLVGEHGPW